jgi:hypothetical protein
MNQILVICIGISILAWIVFDFKKQKQLKQVLDNRNDTKKVQMLLDEYGEPDELIVLDATKIEEAEAVVMIYKGKGFWIVMGRKILRRAITEVTFNNASTPYGIGDYQIVLRTTLDDTPYIWLHVGNERNRAKEIFEKIQDSLIK